jgi:6-phosphogluconolactonase
MPLAVSPDRRVLHASIRSEPFAVATFSIDPRDGHLAPLGRTLLPASCCWIGTDRSGRYLLSASYGSSLVAVSPVDAGGRVGTALQVTGTPANAHSVRADPANRFLLVTCLGGGVVLCCRFDEASGGFAVVDASTFHARPGAGPRHFVFHPSAPFVYLLNELDATVDVLAWDAAKGSLLPLQTIATLPPGFAGKPWAADLHLTPDARFLYSCERTSSTLCAFAVDAATGRLERLGHAATETQPRSFAIDPSGRWLVSAGQLFGRVCVHGIDTETGRLARHGSVDVGADPNWVEIVGLPTTACET